MYEGDVVEECVSGDARVRRGYEVGEVEGGVGEERGEVEGWGAESENFDRV